MTSPWHLPASAEAVVEGCLTEQQAVANMYARYSTSILRFLRGRVSSRQTAEDLLHETFLRAVKGMSRFEDRGYDFQPWLMTIARNLVIDHYRSEQLRHNGPEPRALETDVADSSAGPEEQALHLVDVVLLHAALRALPADQRGCLEMRFLRGLSLRETSVLLQRDVGAVKSLQHRSLLALRAIAHRDGWAA